MEDDSLLNENNMHSIIHALAAAIKNIKELEKDVDTLISVCYSLNQDVEYLKVLMEGDMK